MKKLLAAIGLSVSLLGCSAYAQSVWIESCYDGDTCTTSQGEKIRLACIDAPELRGENAQPRQAKQARDFLRRAVVGRELGISRKGPDKYGRTVAELFVSGTSLSIGELMVSAEHARIDPRYADQCAWTSNFR